MAVQIGKGRSRGRGEGKGRCFERMSEGQKAGVHSTGMKEYGEK